MADTGFFSGKNVTACEAAGIEPLIVVARDEHHAGWRDRFTEPAPLPSGTAPVERMATQQDQGWSGLPAKNPMS